MALESSFPAPPGNTDSLDKVHRGNTDRNRTTREPRRCRPGSDKCMRSQTARADRRRRSALLTNSGVRHTKLQTSYPGYPGLAALPQIRFALAQH